jgi:hypothetical protein
MTITESEMKDVLDAVLEYFDKEEVVAMDNFFMEFHTLREESKTVLEFLSKVKEKYPDNHNVLIAGVLYGIRLGEMSYNYQTQKTELPKFGHAC